MRIIVGQELLPKASQACKQTNEAHLLLLNELREIAMDSIREHVVNDAVLMEKGSSDSRDFEMN